MIQKEGSVPQNKNLQESFITKLKQRNKHWPWQVYVWVTTVVPTP